MRRVVKAARPFRAGETIFVMKPLVAYMNADCNEYDYCFTCKKFLIAEHIRCSRCCGFGYCNKKCEKLQQFHYLFCFPREKNNMENCPDLSGRLKDLKFFSEEKKKSMSQSKRFFYQLQELARTSKRPIFYAIAPLYAMVEQNESDEQFRDAFSHLYIPTPMPNASKLSKEEHNLMNKFINPSNDNLEFYIALVCKLLYNQLSFQSKPSSNGTFVNSGKGLYPCASFFDHSCSPNVHMFSASGTSELTFVASQHIQENELMTINYLENPRLTGEERRKILHSTFDFNCDCLLCKEDLKTQ
ncbi:histone-lysine N-methyltransferase SMYD3-like [Zophobas morio]|uniref:histone-lysine N-methyltransferase SMYD3-like n=1 Tax=Zophobas morio TaxID=2755281 RepID=UPI003082FB1F